jgi:hypothetical protein
MNISFSSNTVPWSWLLKLVAMELKEEKKISLRGGLYAQCNVKDFTWQVDPFRLDKLNNIIICCLCLKMSAVYFKQY